MNDDNQRRPSRRGGDGTDSQFTISEYDRASIGVVEAVAAATDRNPGALPQLGHVIDPDALDDLLDHGGDVEIAFEYAGAEVTVHGDGTVFVAGT